MRLAHTIRGSDNSMTAQEYTVISMPACASLMEKEAEILVSNPIGINSEVLKINADTVIPSKGNHSFLVINEPSFTGKKVYCKIHCDSIRNLL